MARPRTKSPRPPWRPGIEETVLDDLAVSPDIDGTVLLWRAWGMPPPAHRHRELEMNLVRRGTGSFLLREKRHVLRPGVVVWLFPGQDHVLVEPSPDLEMWIAVFRPSLVERVATTAGRAVMMSVDPPGTFSRRVDPVSDAGRRLEALFCEVAAAHGDAAMTNAGLAFLLTRAWSAFHEQGEVSTLQDVHPAVEKAAMTIRDHPELSHLDEIARRSGLSAGRLSRLFRQQLGVSPIEYRDRRRVECFVDLYGDGTRRSVAAAAELAGFGSYAQFLRVFRAVIGTTPMLWARRPR